MHFNFCSIFKKKSWNHCPSSTFQPMGGRVVGQRLFGFFWGRDENESTFWDLATFTKYFLEIHILHLRFYLPHLQHCSSENKWIKSKWVSTFFTWTTQWMFLCIFQWMFLYISQWMFFMYIFLNVWNYLKYYMKQIFS